MTSDALELNIKNRLDELAPLAERVEIFIQGQSLPDRWAHEVNVALEEVVTNTVSYGYSDLLDHSIGIRLERQGSELRVEIEDDGQPFNPLEREDPDVTKPIHERRIGGLGIYLVKRLMDEVRYERRNGKNVLRLVKRIPVVNPETPV